MTKYLVRVIHAVLLVLILSTGRDASAADGSVREAIAVAQELRQSDNLYDQIAGAGLLADVGDKAALQFVVDQLQHPDQSLQRAAIDTLLDVQNPAGIDIIYRLASMGEHGLFIKFMVESLATRPRDNMTELLIDTLALDDVWIKKHALQALAQMPLGDHVARIHDIAHDGAQDPLSRAYASYALLRTSYRDEAVDELARIAVNGLLEAKEVAAVGLGQIDSARSREALHALRQETDQHVKLAVLASEAGLGDKEAIAALTQVIAQGKGMDGAAAAASLRRLPAAVTVQITDELIACCPLPVDTAARLIEAWASIKADPARLYAWAFRHPDPGVRMQAVWLIGQRGERKYLDAVFPLLKDSDAGLRGMAAWTVVRLLGDDG